MIDEILEDLSPPRFLDGFEMTTSDLRYGLCVELLHGDRLVLKNVAYIHLVFLSIPGPLK